LLIPGAHAEILQQTVLNIINPTVNIQFLSATPSVLDDRRLRRVGDLLFNVDFAQTPEPGGLIGLRGQLFPASLINIPDMAEPIIDQTMPMVPDGRRDPSAAVMSADDHMLDLKHIDRVLQNRKTIHIRMNDQIGHVAMDEEFAGQQPDDFVGRHPAIGASDPEIFRVLLKGERLEESRIPPNHPPGPKPVVGEQRLNCFHRPPIITSSAIPAKTWSALRLSPAAVKIRGHSPERRIAMKKLFGSAVMIALVAGGAFAGVTKSQKSEITFKGFGTMSSTSTDQIVADRKLSDMNAEFKGKGLLGGLAGKTMFRSGHTGDLVDLAGMTTYQIDHKKKQYTVTPMEKWAETQRQMQGAGRAEDPAAEKTESDIRIVKNEFKVEDTGEAKTINGFACRKFLALWTVEWENTRTGEKGTDRLETASWTTPMTNDLQAAQAEEMAFAQSYMKAIGFDSATFQRDVLGTQWIGLLAAFDPVNGKSKMTPDSSAFTREMGKIKGYPIVVDGKYFPAPKAKPAEEEPSSGGGLGGALGKIGAGLLKKKPNPEEEKAPAVSFYTEITALSTTAIDPASLQVPAGYKKK
jgi:hypothetical protein